MASPFAFRGVYPHLVAVDNACTGVLPWFYLPQLGVAFGPVFHAVFIVVHTAPSFRIWFAVSVLHRKEFMRKGHLHLAKKQARIWGLLFMAAYFYTYHDYREPYEKYYIKSQPKLWGYIVLQRSFICISYGNQYGSSSYKTASLL